jgi:hypothetical protein
MPNKQTVFEWIRKYPEFAEQYRVARMAQADATYEDMISIEEDLLAGKLEAQPAKIVLDSMKWRASKMLPKKYGDYKQLQIEPVQVQQQQRPHDMDIEALRKSIAEDEERQANG